MVTVRSKPSEVASAGLMRLETWTNLGTEDQNLSADRLLAVFVKVRHRRTYTRLRHCRTNLINLGTEEQNLSADRLLAVFVKVRHRRTTRLRHCRTTRPRHCRTNLINLGTEDQNLSADRLLAVFVKVRHRRTYSPASLQD